MPDPSPEPNLRRAERAPNLWRAEAWAVGTAVAFLAVFVGIGVVVGFDAPMARIARLDAGLILGLLMLSFVNYLVRFCRWHVFAGQLGVSIPPVTSAVYYVAGFAMTVTPGKLGEALRLWLIRRSHGYGYERTAPMFIADRVSDAGALMILAVASLFAFSTYLWQTLAVGAVVLAGTLAAFRPGALIRVVTFAYACVRRRPKIFAWTRSTLRRLARLGDWRVYGPTLVLAVGGWLAECVALYWLLSELGAPVSLGQAVFVFSFAMLAGALAMLPGGLGGAEVGMVGLLTLLGVGIDVAVAATAIIRLTTLWFAVALGFLALPLALRLSAAGAVAH